MASIGSSGPFVARVDLLRSEDLQWHSFQGCDAGIRRLSSRSGCLYNLLYRLLPLPTDLRLQYSVTNERARSDHVA
jgi:hypothetical protein